jgi:hypothetical protein
VKLINNKAKYTKDTHHKILLVSDSHLRECAAKTIASLDARVYVCGVVKPGLVTGSLMEMSKGEVGQLTKTDFLTICSGTNDTNRNDSRNAFRDITNFIKKVNNTNIILTRVPFRHDLSEYSEVNNKIKTFEKLLKLAKIFSHVNIIETVNSRLVFTKYGLHLNETEHPVTGSGTSQLHCTHACLCVNCQLRCKGTMHGVVYHNQIEIRRSKDISERVISTISRCVVQTV